MSHYQSFPGSDGASRSLEKLEALRLPDMKGKTFLDVGCNEGFFSGFAEFSGADRSVGIDLSSKFIKAARERFPKCEFHEQSWDHIPGNQFDVILLASAIHYADDQPALIEHLVNHLSPTGTLVIELGLVESNKADWFKVQRGIDQRYFASKPMLEKVLEPYAWKWIGRSVSQAGDPVKRFVVHVSRRRPLAFLLMMPPGFGKSSIGKRAFGSNEVPLISNDVLLASIAKSRNLGSPQLRKLVARTFTPITIDKTISAIFDEKLESDLVDTWIEAAKGTDLAMEGYIPENKQQSVLRELERRGYLPVVLSWELPGQLPASISAFVKRAALYYRTLAGADGDTTPVADTTRHPAGFVETMRFEPTAVTVVGWAFGANGELPQSLIIRMRDRTYVIDNITPTERPDVRKAHDLASSSVGFRIKIDLDESLTADKLTADEIVVLLPSGLPLTVSSKLRLQ